MGLTAACASSDADIEGVVHEEWLQALNYNALNHGDMLSSLSYIADVRSSSNPHVQELDVITYGIKNVDVLDVANWSDCVGGFLFLFFSKRMGWF